MITLIARVALVLVVGLGMVWALGLPLLLLFGVLYVLVVLADGK